MGKRADRPIIDLHCHIGPPLLGEELIGMMDQAGIDRAVIFPIPWLWTFPREDNYYNTNDYIADMQAKYPGRFIGFACINPQFVGHQELGMPNLAVAELERCVKELGLRGLKIHPENHSFAVDMLVNSEFMKAVARLQKETNRKIPILSHGMTTIGAMPDQFGKVASRYPEVPIIIAHGAGFQNLYFPSNEAVIHNENLYVDTAMTTVDDGHLLGVAARVGVEKIIFGSDHFGRNQKNLYGNFLYVLERAFPDAEQRALILGGNLTRIMGLDWG